MAQDEHVMVSKAQLYQGLVSAVDTFARCLHMPDSAELISDVTKVHHQSHSTVASAGGAPIHHVVVHGSRGLYTRRPTLGQSRTWDAGVVWKCGGLLSLSSQW